MKSTKKYPVVNADLTKAKLHKNYTVSTWEYEKKLSQVMRKKKEKELNKKLQALNL
jgi:hypothetical protein